MSNIHNAREVFRVQKSDDENILIPVDQLSVVTEDSNLVTVSIDTTKND